MAAEEKIREAVGYKEEGNRHYGEGNFKRALGAYHKVFCYINGLQPPPPERAAGKDGDGATGSQAPAPGGNQIPRDRVEEVQKLKQSTKLNMAACYLKLGEHQKCIDACSAALDFGSSSKAHFRRGQAYAELRNFAGARNDFERARELAPEDPAIVAELRKVRESFSKGDAKERRQCAKMISSAPPDPRAAAAATAAAASADSRETGPRIEEVADDDDGEPAPSGQGASAATTAGRTSGAEDCPAGGSGEPAAAAATAAAAAAAPPVSPGAGTVVQPLSSESVDEVRKVDFAVRELKYAWQQSEEDVKIYVSFDQSEELEGGVEESRVQVEYGEWSVLLLIRPSEEGRTPFGLRLGDFHRRLAPERCRCTVRSSRITLKLVKQVKEHWWNLLQNVPLHAG